MNFHFYFTGSLLALCINNLAWAHSTNNAVDGGNLENISVTAKKNNISAKQLFIGNKTILDAKKLQYQRAPTLGETLAKTAGIQSEHFGPNSGRPVIRSLSGSRVQLLHNNLSIQDMAIISGNLPTQIEPFMAQKIEVIKGASSVLYGGSAIGGSVSIEDGRIPEHIAEKKFNAKIDINGGYNTPNTQMFRLDGNNGYNWAWHISGLRRHISSYKIPNKSKPDVCYDLAEAGNNTPLRDMCQMNLQVRGGGVNPAYYPRLSQYFIDNPDELESERDKYTWRRDSYIRGKGFVRNPANPSYVDGTLDESMPIIKGPLTDMVPTENGKIPNSHLNTQSWTIGSSYIGQKWFAGLAINHHRTDYGVPGFIYADAWSNLKKQKVGYQPANIRAQQTRVDAKAAINKPFMGIERIALNLAYNKAKNGDYLGDLFSGGLNSKGKQARLEISHQPLGPLLGTFGVAFNTRNIESTGEDAYMPSVKSQERGFFILEKARFGSLQVEAGTRWDVVKHQQQKGDYQAGKNFGDFLNRPHRFSLKNHHLGLRWQINDQWHLQVQRSLAERAPEANELYASNLHLANLVVEEGNAKQTKERARTWEIGVGFESDDFNADIAWYQSKFENYSYLGFTGLSNSKGIADANAGRLLIKQWRQHDAYLQGIEFNVRYRFLNNFSGEWTATIFGDIVKNKPIYHSNNSAKRLAGNYMPGMPTSRYGAELSWQRKNWQAAIGAVRYAKQKNVGKVINDEPILPGYTLVDARLSYTHKNQYGQWEGYLQGNNLTNKTAHPFNSTLKYLAPLPGRSIVAGLRWSF